MTRPKITIDEEVVFKLAELQCTYAEIASFFRVCPTTIKTRFKDIVEQGKESGKCSLRRLQFRLAEKSAAMAIWLGKQYLGQTEKMEYINEDMVKSEIVIVESLPKEAVPTDLKERFKKYIQE